jgi:hypothetical protein
MCLPTAGASALFGTMAAAAGRPQVSWLGHKLSATKAELVVQRHRQPTAFAGTLCLVHCNVYGDIKRTAWGLCSCLVSGWPSGAFDRGCKAPVRVCCRKSLLIIILSCHSTLQQPSVTSLKTCCSPSSAAATAAAAAAPHVYACCLLPSLSHTRTVSRLQGGDALPLLPSSIR